MACVVRAVARGTAPPDEVPPPPRSVYFIVI